jgi:hypothetical protein
VNIARLKMRDVVRRVKRRLDHQMFEVSGFSRSGYPGIAPPVAVGGDRR